jgi:colanic acid biosynthesis glycosyl transferase WcaI
VKVLILGLNFAPEPVGVGKYTGDLAHWLSERGHDVRVITAPPYYPEWRLRATTGRRWQRERLGRTWVLRCPLWVPSEPSAARRMLHLLSFAASSFLPCLWQAVRWRPDVVLAIEPTLLAAPTALLAARITGALACLHVQDLEINAACGLGLVPYPRICRLARTVYGSLLRRFDLVSTISRRMRRQLEDMGIASGRLCRFPNWVDTGVIHPLGRPSVLRQALGIAPDEVVALYSGSMGAKQGMGQLADLAERLGSEQSLHLVLCGAGPARKPLERQLAGQPNVHWLPLQSPARLNELLNLADIHLLPQLAGVGDCLLPSKLGGILASGRPVVAQADGGEVSAIARSCGLVVPPGDGAAMAAAVRALAGDPERRGACGRKARRMAERHLERTWVLGRFERRLEESLEMHVAGRSSSRRRLGGVVDRIASLEAWMPSLHPPPTRRP